MEESRSQAVIAASYLIGIGFYSDLPGPYLPTDHDAPFLRPLIAFLLPTAAAVTYGIHRNIRKFDRLRSAEAFPESIYTAIVFRMMLFLMALHTLVVADLIGVAWVRAWAGRGVLVLFGFLLIGIGNLLPCTRPNLALGLRTTRTFADRHLWIQIHRSGGYAAVFLGLVLAVSGAFLTGKTLPNAIGTAAIVAVSAVCISYWRYSHA